MWYEIIPSLGIICGAMWLSGKGLGAVQRLQNGGKVNIFFIIFIDFTRLLPSRNSVQVCTGQVQGRVGD